MQRLGAELKAAESASALDPLIPLGLRERLLILGRVAQELAQGRLQQAKDLWNLGSEVGALAYGTPRERRVEFARSPDGALVNVRVQSVEGGRVLDDQAAPVPFEAARDFFSRVTSPEGKPLHPGATIGTTVSVPDTD